MREIVLNKSGALKSRKLVAELFVSDLETSVKSFTPGEWARFYNPKKDESFIGFVNPFVQERGPCAYLIQKIERNEPADIESLLEAFIKKALDKRERISDYGLNGRMVYGSNDNLPGLIVDSFANCALIQINTAGLDLYREKIKKALASRLKKPTFLLDNPSYRSAENLPLFNETVDIEFLEIIENSLSYKLNRERLQKVGFYYDHRENRRKLSNYLGRLKNKPAKGMDLFCYLGAWGFTMAKAGVQNVAFVDQGNFEEEIEKNWKRNNLSGNFKFSRDDVFKTLKSLSGEKSKFDIIVSDPPAFCKSPKGLKKASEGYLRLHRACFKLLEDHSLFAACSCTRYMDMDSFVQNINLAAAQEQKKVSLLDVGSQGFDHPSSGFKDKSNYLKYTLFYVENL